MEYYAVGCNRSNRSVLTKITYLIFFFICLGLSQDLFANPRTPSQALPDFFKRYEKRDFYDLKKQQQTIPEIPKIQSPPTIPEDPDLKIIPETIIILAPKELQKVIDFERYKNEILQKEQSINDLYKIADELTNEFNTKGYPLVRVTLPSQELDSENAAVFFKVIDGQIETLDLSKVPANQAMRIYHYLKPLIKKKALTQKELNRRLILAGNISGIKLNSGFFPGVNEGGTKLIIEASHKYISGTVEFNNFQSEQLARQQGQLSTSIHSALGLGETLSMFGLARPTDKGVRGTGRDVPIRAGGLSFSLPIGNNGTTVGFSYMESMTRPGANLESLSLEANMKSGSATISHPLVYQPDMSWFIRGTANWVDEIQHTNLSGEDEDISHDRLTNVRLGTSITSCGKGCTSFDAEISRGLELFSRSASEAATGTPLSRMAATSTYTHLNAELSYSRVFYEKYRINMSGGGQYTDDSLLNSEQASVIGENKVSSLSSGAITGDKEWHTRLQVNYDEYLSQKLMLSPYVYGAMGVAFINQPTSTENKTTAAKSIGIGLEFNGGDDFFFDKNIYGKAEFSKTWATKKIEDQSDIRLNNNQVAVKLAMAF